tara:strand:+ start:3074 stop:3679 length:606 start_codon:yes stop_codon:yes gene_type:complete
VAGEFEDNFGGGFFGDGGDFGQGPGNVGGEGEFDDAPDEDEDFSIFDTGPFGLIGSILSFFAKSTPIGLGLSLAGRGLDALFGTDKLVSDAVKGAFGGGGRSDIAEAFGAGFFGSNPDFFEGRPPAGPEAPGGGGEDEPIVVAKREERRAGRRVVSPPVSAASLTTQTGTPQSRVADAFTGRRRPGTLFSTETGLADTLGG